MGEKSYSGLRTNTEDIIHFLTEVIIYNPSLEFDWGGKLSPPLEGD